MQLTGKCRHQRRLADARLAEHRKETLAAIACFIEGALEQFELIVRPIKGAAEIVPSRAMAGRKTAAISPKPANCSAPRSSK
jgi:hypothetical protein